jgi:hypothetical protein
MRPEDQNVPSDAAVERRVALRRGAAVIAGVAGLSAAAAATGSAAEAAPGDPVVQGQSNDAGAATTSVTSSSGTGTLQVANSGTGAPLRVAVKAGIAPASTSIAGDIYSTDFNQDGFAFPAFTHVTGTGDTDPAAFGFLFTDVWAFQPIPVIPQRALDTRTADGRRNIVNAAGNLDATGRLLGGHTITLSLNDFTIGFGGVYANITVTGTAGQGFVSVYPADPRPTPSSINFVAGQTLSNFSFTAMNFDVDTLDNTVRIFALVTTHVLFDVTAFAVGSTGQVAGTILPAGMSSAAARATKIDPAKAPAWYRENLAKRSM